MENPMKFKKKTKGKLKELKSIIKGNGRKIKENKRKTKGMKGKIKEFKRGIKENEKENERGRML